MGEDSDCIKGEKQEPIFLCLLMSLSGSAMYMPGDVIVRGTHRLISLFTDMHYLVLHMQTNHCIYVHPTH